MSERPFLAQVATEMTDQLPAVSGELAKELYEAARATRNWATKQDLLNAGRLCVNACARYEKEVGT